MSEPESVLSREQIEEFALEACPQDGFDSLDEARDFIQRIAEAAAAAQREWDAKIAEGGSFLHDEAPDARFGRAVAAAIRRSE